MTKTDSSSWPDPSEWIRELHQNMADRYPVYENEPDALLRRNKAASMLALVVGSLLELPPFRNDNVHLPLKDLLVFLVDLDRGRNHPWSIPVNFGGTNITTSAQSELKSWVRSTYEILTRNGFKPVEAYRHIAKGLTRSGRTGRKGAAIRWQLVQSWCLETRASRDDLIAKKVQRWWADFLAGDVATSDAILIKSAAAKFADLCWSLPHLRDRSVSGVSE